MAAAGRAFFQRPPLPNNLAIPHRRVFRNGKADRVCTRSGFHNGHFNVSIRARLATQKYTVDFHFKSSILLPLK
jgi:hypothetical protein